MATDVGVETRLANIDGLLQELLAQKATKDYYSTQDVAERMWRSEYQVREWCRLGRLKAEKRGYGRGTSKEWMIPHEELVRYESYGLRPVVRSPA